MEYATKIWRKALDLIFPKKIKLRELEEMSEGSLRALLPKADNSLNLQGIFPLFDYRDESVRKLVWEIKYRRNPVLAGRIAALMHEEMLEGLADLELFEGGQMPLLIPIPMSAERRKERGFNQTEFLAKLIHKKAAGISLDYAPDALVKTRHTKPQADLKRAERLENLRGAYKVAASERVLGCCIILIDDVTTTGSTIREAMQALKNAGAKEVIAFTVAH